MVRVSPMLAESGTERDLDDPTMAGEPKVDGTRGWIGKDDEDTFWIVNRKQVDYTSRLPEIVEAMKSLPAGDFVIDGELIVYDENGRTWFEGSQRRCATQDLGKQRILKLKYPIFVGVFDVIKLDGKDLRNYGWQTRKQLLQQLLQDSPQTTIFALPHTIERKREMFNAVVKLGEEGLIVKDLNSPYVGSRSRYWLKVKKWYEERCRVVGYTPGTGSRASLFGSLMLAKLDDDGFYRYCGKVGSGFSNAELRHILRILKAGEKKEPLIDARDELGKPIPHMPVKVDLEITVRFYETSKNGVFRFPSILKDRRGNNYIHYDARTLKGSAPPSQRELKNLLQDLR